MSRYFMRLSFKGTHYHGWQIQPNGMTVQELLTRALQLILGDKEISLTGMGRTDSGVHARDFVAHFDTALMPADLSKTVFRLNRYLPADVVVHSIIPVRNGAHARFDALYRRYHYHIVSEKDPFRIDTAWHLFGPLDVEAMNTAAALLLQHSDFSSFARLHSDVKTYICRLSHARWVRQGSLLVFEIQADRFLRNMVRAIVGTLVAVGQHKMSPGDFEEVIGRRDRSAAGESAPAKGLFFVGVGYPDELFIQPKNHKEQ